MSTSTYVMLTLPVMFGSTVLVLDQGMLRVAREEAQSAADAAALAGMHEAFNDTSGAMRDEALRVATLHRIAGAQVATSDVTVVVDTDHGQNTGIQVTVVRGGIPPLFGGILGWTAYSVRATAAVALVPTVRQVCENTVGGAAPCGIFADQSLELGGNAEISTEGGSDAALCTNAAEITASGSADLENGQIDLYVGPGCTDSSGMGCLDLNGNVDMSGIGVDTLDNYVDIPYVDEVPTDNDGWPSHKGGAGGKYFPLVEEGGDYVLDETARGNADKDATLTDATERAQSFTNTIYVNVGADGTCTTPTNLYITSSVSFHGNGGIVFANLAANGNVTATFPPVPECLNIYVIGAVDVRFNGGSDLGATVFAPEASVRLNGNSAFHGAAVGRDIDITGTGDLFLDPDADLGLVASGRTDCSETEVVETVVTQPRIVQ